MRWPGVTTRGEACLPSPTGESGQPPASPPSPRALIWSGRQASGGPKGRSAVSSRLPPHLSSQSQGWEGPPQGSSRFLPVVGEGRGVAIWGRWHLKVRERRPFSGNCQPGSRGPPQGAPPLNPHSCSLSNWEDDLGHGGGHSLRSVTDGRGEGWVLQAEQVAGAASQRAPDSLGLSFLPVTASIPGRPLPCAL